MFRQAVNLLPPPKKSKLENLVRFIFVKNMLEIVLITAAVLAISLIWSWLTLQEDFNSLSESAIVVSQEFTTQNQEVRDANRRLENFNNAGQGFKRMLPELLTVADNLPKDITLNSLNINRADSSLSISGSALTRQALLDYQEKLKEITWLENVSSPISRLLQKENIPFEFKIKIKGWPSL
ncbi:MAG TPA: PilN domain-containing protein [Patescibacteria group bacterium]|nr:PilN domain-containing protein [Patescibacteria group bacterium]